MNPYIPIPAEIIEVKEECSDVKTFKLDVTMDFKPGQFVMIYVPGAGEAPFTIASRIREPLEVTVKKVGKVTTALHKLGPGAKIGVRGPYGKPLPLDLLRGSRTLLVAAGIGVAYFRSLILSCADMFRELVLLYGARYPDSIVYKDEMKEWRGVKVMVTLSRPPEEWKGLRGRVTEHLKKMDVEKYDYFILCGPRQMMRDCIDILVSRGVDLERIYVSLERHMKCGIGLCGRCRLQNGLYVCVDGPTFRADQIKDVI